VRTYLICVLTLIVLVVSVLSCASRLSDDQASNTSDDAGLGFTPTPLACPTIEPLPPIGSGDSGMAPSFEEIRYKVKCILQGNRPWSQQQVRDVTLFQQSIIGRRVEDWQGWVLGVTPVKADVEVIKNTRDPNYAPSLHVWVSMDDPATRINSNRLTSDVMLFGVSQDQASSIRAWNDPLNTENPWQKVWFDGEIINVSAYDYVDVLITDIQADTTP
jgi:hypothetical protein